VYTEDEDTDTMIGADIAFGIEITDTKVAQITAKKTFTLNFVDF
jgi:hypothetical protein